MITFNHLEIGFDQNQCAQELSGDIKTGEITALVGINGAGKSCLIKTLAGLIPKMSGELKLFDKDLISFSEKERADHIAIVLTDKVNVDFLRVEELVSLGKSHTNYFGLLNPEDQKEIEEALILLGLNEVRQTYFNQLSDGLKQRALIARAVVQAKHFLFLDEPTTFLDIPSKRYLMKALQTISKNKNLGILFSTHDINLLESNVDSVWLLDKKGKLFRESPEQMKQSGLYESNFFQD
jgi:iron complex transport system ATP-binding protein